MKSSVSVIMMSTFVSGPTAHICHSLQLKQLVNNETVLSYRASITVTFSPSWESFVLLQGTCWEVPAFGSMFMQLVSAADFTGLTDHH